MPPTDLDSLSTEELQQLLKKTQGQQSTLTDIAQTIPSSVVKTGVGMAATPGTVADLSAKLATGVHDYMFPPPPDLAGTPATAPGGNPAVIAKTPPQGGQQLSPYDSIKKLAESATGPLYDPQTTPGKLVDATIQASPVILGGPGQMGRKLVTGMAGVAGGELGKEAAEDNGFTSLAPYSEALGLAAGSFSPAGLRKLATLFSASRAQLEMANVLKGAGIDVSAGLKTGSPTLQRWEGAFTGKPTGLDPKQITSAFLSMAGADPATATSGASPGPIIQSLMGGGKVQGELGKKMDALANTTQASFFQRDPATGKTVRDAAGDPIPEKQLDGDVKNIMAEYQATGGKLTGDSPIEEAMRGVFGNPNAPSKPDGLSGSRYQTVRRNLSDRADDLWHSGDAASARAVRQLASALDSNMVRTSPNGAAWPELFGQYESAKVLRKAIAMKSSAPPGMIDPGNVHSAAQGHPNSPVFKVSQAATQIGNVGPQTTPLSEHILPLAGMAAATGLGLHYGGDAGLIHALSVDPLVGYFASKEAARLGGRALGPVANSRAGQAYFGNQVFNPESTGVGGAIGRATVLNPKLDSITAAKLLALEGARRNAD